MVRRQRPIACRQRSAVQRRQLLGMQLDRQIQLAGGIEHALDLHGRKRQVLTECIDGVDQAFGRQHRQHALRHLVDIVVRAPGELGRQRVRGQAGGPDRHGQGLPQPPGHPQHFALVRQVQPVTRLHFQRGHAVAKQVQGSFARAGVKLVFRRGARSAHRAGDAAALRRDRGVVHALQPLLELQAAVAAEHQVRVAVDKPGRDPRSAQIVLPLRIDGRQRRLRADPFDAIVQGHDGGALDRRIGAPRHRCGVEITP
ncbi:hypothetical protein D9M68_569230 [compost metagenome]